MMLILLILALTACSEDNGDHKKILKTGNAPSPTDHTFDIDLHFPPGHRFSSSQMELVCKVAARWESIILNDIEDMDYTVPFNSDEEEWGDARVGTVVIDSLVDDVAILVTTALDTFSEAGTSWAYAGPIHYRSANSLPIISQVVVAETALTPAMEQDGTLEMMLLHEFAHAIGFGTAWGDHLVKDRSVGGQGTDPHFAGPLAVAVFNLAGGVDYTGNKVPLAVGDDSHWRGSVLGGELMSMNYGPALSLITLQTFADLGYKVDETLAEAYTLPKGSPRAKPVAKWTCRVE